MLRRTGSNPVRPTVKKRVRMATGDRQARIAQEKRRRQAILREARARSITSFSDDRLEIMRRGKIITMYMDLRSLIVVRGSVAQRVEAQCSDR